MLFSWKHVKTIIIRRFLIDKRSKNAVFSALIPTLIFLFVGIIMEKLVVLKDDLHPDPVSFKTYRQNNPSYVMVYSDTISDNIYVKQLEQATHDIIAADIGTEPTLYRFGTIEEMNENVYNMMLNSSKEDLNIIIGLKIDDTIQEAYYPITVLFNDTNLEGNPSILTTYDQLYRIVVKAVADKQLLIRNPVLANDVSTNLVGGLTPMFIFFGLVSLSTLFAKQVIEDVKKEKRDYMQTCKMSLLSYWVGCFIVDYLFWLIIAIVEWIILFAIGSQAFENQPGATIFCFVFSGVSILILIYCISFLFQDPTNGASFVMMLLYLPIIAVYLIETFKKDGGEKALSWVYGAYPVAGAFQFVTTMAMYSKESFSKMWTMPKLQGLLVMMILDIPIYSLILVLIEYCRVRLAQKSAKSDFTNYKDFFHQKKERQNITQEAIDMENDVDASETQYAVKISHLSKLFYSSDKKPIAAVNDVSLGVKKSELFGFLGANGAGKTTVLHIIMKKIPASNGFVEINGVNIENQSDKQEISICPQFNDHLTKEMTVIETLKFFADLYDSPQAELEKFINEYVPLLELDEHKDKIVSELSGGNARKLAILVAFLSPANILLLDEPTSSIDPVARRKVHELIQIFKGQRTFMLCTHLLDEAESLCDNISMMISGCVYTVGSPQYLSARFGTEWKVDVLLDTEGDSERVKSYFKETFPSSKITIQRHQNITYSIPSNDVEIGPLFHKLNEAIKNQIGIKYFTCSASSLEKVFLELIMRSEHQNAEDNEVKEY